MLSPPCALARRMYESANQQPTKPDPVAVIKARKAIATAQHPLIIVDGTVDQETIGQLLDMTVKNGTRLLASEAHAGAAHFVALKTTGYLTATLGDLNQLANQVVVCGDPPEKTLPRFWDFIDRSKWENAICFEKDLSLAFIQQLRLAYRAWGSPKKTTLGKAIAQIQTAPSGLLVLNDTSGQMDESIVDEWLAWLAELGSSRPWFGLMIPASPNGKGVHEVILAKTGCPRNLIFQNGWQRYSERVTPLSILTHQETDLVILLGEHASLPDACVEAMAKQRTIQISAHHRQDIPGTWLPAGQQGVEASGTMLRLDGVPVSLDALTASELRSTAQVVADLFAGAA